LTLSASSIRPYLRFPDMSPGSAPIVQLIDASASYGTRRALSGVTFSAAPGELVYVIGESGAGKSSLLKLIDSELEPAAGEVWVDGYPLHQLSRRDVARVRRRVGVVYQDIGLLASMTALENVEFAYRVSHITDSRRSGHERALSALEMVGLGHRADSFPRHLSGGEQQRVAIARATVSQPPIVLADEPTGNLDRQRSLEILDLLTSLADRGSTVIVATHDQDLIGRSDGRRVLRVEAGRVTEDWQLRTAS
jgi:cell division transport system ATP-binding protein